MLFVESTKNLYLTIKNALRRICVIGLLRIFTKNLSQNQKTKNIYGCWNTNVWLQLINQPTGLLFSHISVKKNLYTWKQWANKGHLGMHRDTKR